MERQRRVWLIGVVFVVGCRPVDLPDPPAPPGPGEIQGRAVRSLPGTFRRVPVVGARVAVLNTAYSTTTDSNGAFRIANIASEVNEPLLLQADLDADGKIDLQRLYDLGALRPSLGKVVVLGDIPLTENAVVKGRVLLSDRPDAGSGLGGTLVFVPQGPFIDTTGDDARMSRAR